MREIIFDTETTGFKPEEGERIIEIGAIEMVNRVATGRTFHEYINPQGKEVNPGAFKVHGISNEFLNDKKPFKDVADDFLEFIEGAYLVAHNASFDMNFLNHELSWIDKAPINDEWVIDTLKIARKKHPMAQNSLDRLCDRYKIDNTKRTKHGALLDSELLAEVYIELLGGRQTNLELEGNVTSDANDNQADFSKMSGKPQRQNPLASLLSDEERAAHELFIETMGEKAIWKTYSN